MEEEYQLLDGVSFDLVQHIETVLAAIAGHELEPQINPELMQSVLEIATPVCHTPADVMGELVKLREYVCGVARATGMRVGSAGTHPFSLFERQRITAKDRYRQLVDQLQYIARRELIFGMHVHVAVDDPDKAIKVMNGLLPQLGPLLALSASSPFWRGEPTGLASSRQMVFASFPRSGPPRASGITRTTPTSSGSWSGPAASPTTRTSGGTSGPTHGSGTIEIRICDAVTRVEDAVAITAYCQALVKQLSERFDAGEEIPSYHRILTTENKWLAARYGLEAPVMDLATGRRNRIPVAQLVRRTVREIEPHARELGSERELEGIGELLARGNSADRQLRIFNANRDIREVVEEIAIATETLPAAGRRIARGLGGVESEAMLQRRRPDPEARVWGGRREVPTMLRGGGGRRRDGPPLLLPVRLVADLHERGPAPRRQESRPACRRGAAVSHLTGLPWSHAAWATTLGVEDIPLLSDWNGDATRGFGIAREPQEMLDVPARSAFLIEGDTVRASWLLGSDLPDVDAVIAAASSPSL